MFLFENTPAPAVSVIAGQLRDKNCLAAFLSRDIKMSLLAHWVGGHHFHNDSHVACDAKRSVAIAPAMPWFTQAWGGGHNGFIRALTTTGSSLL